MNAKPETQITTFKRAFKLHNDCISRFKMINGESLDNLIVGTLNINSISPKFGKFKLMVSGYFDVTIVKETRLDDSFPKEQLYTGSVEEYAHFEKFFVDALNKHAPLKKKVVSA